MSRFTVRQSFAGRNPGSAVFDLRSNVIVLRIPRIEQCLRIGHWMSDQARYIGIDGIFSPHLSGYTANQVAQTTFAMA
jgi:hypothetical protein